MTVCLLSFASIQLEVSCALYAMLATTLMKETQPALVINKLLMELNSTDPFVDFDECTLNTSGCSQNCTNTIGSYYCSCQSSYYLDTDLKSCTGKYLVFITMVVVQQ